MTSGAYAKNLRQLFPKIYPKVFLPDGMEHEFKIDLEPDTTPIHQPIYKLSPLELQEAKTQIDSMLKHGFIRPSQSPWGSPYYSYQRKTAAFGFVWTTVGWIRGQSGIGTLYRYRKKWWTISRVPKCLAKLIYGRDTDKCQYTMRMYLKPHFECVGDLTNFW